MANSYSTTVTKRELGLDPIPDDAPSRPHHVKRRDGTPSAFQNVHPSAGDGWFDFFPFMKKMVSYVDATPAPVLSPVGPLLTRMEIGP
jgi:hypothetical protein